MTGCKCYLCDILLQLYLFLLKSQFTSAAKNPLSRHIETVNNLEKKKKKKLQIDRQKKNKINNYILRLNKI